MSDGKIHIPAKKREYVNNSGIIRVTPEAYNMLVDVTEDSDGWSMRQVVSTIIVQAVKNNLIHFDKKEE